MKPRIIVCGLGRTGYRIFCLLRQQGAQVVGINATAVEGETSDVIVGDGRSASILLAAGIREANTLVLASTSDSVNLSILVQARVLNPHIRVIDRLFNASLGHCLDRALPDHVSLSVSDLAAPIFAFAALGNQAIGQLHLCHQTWPMREEWIDSAHPWLGRRLSDLWDNRARMLIYYLAAREPVDLVSAVGQGRVLEVGDRLIVATQPHVRSGRRPILPRKLLKFVTGLHRFQEYGRSALLVTLALLLTIFAATITYLCVDRGLSIVNALYFSVGMITGAGGNEGVVEQAPDSIKFFTVIMMLVGTAVVGIFYALLNDFVLGTRFRQFWDAAHVPSRGHYIVCGLGGLGMKIVNQLHQQGHEVVVIEADANGRFLGVARSLGIPVVQGDASLSAVLRAANLQRAEGLLAVTSDDTTNLEIALTAKGLVSRLPVVVRNQDFQFAQMAEQVFDFEAVLSPVDLAAPAFAAAALGGRILGNGLTGDRLWVAIATIITPAHPFCGQQVRTAAIAADFVPLYLETPTQDIHSWSLLDAYLQPGDILYLTMLANRLDQLWRSTSSSLMQELHS